MPAGMVLVAWWMDIWMDGWMDGWMFGLQGFGILGFAIFW
jgi:hypothetical protein